MSETGLLSETPETEISALKEAIQTQQQLLQKLYAELDEEREASATATSEALSMILRLQVEKAAVAMEACQYKRIADEKMYYAEESLATFEDLIYQKEMEIASLEFQVQAYKCKLLSMGYDNFDHLGVWKQRKNFEIMDVDGKVRRINSLPPMQLKDSSYHEKSLYADIYLDQIPDCEDSGKFIDTCFDQPIAENFDSSCSSTVHDIFEVPSNRNVEDVNVGESKLNEFFDLHVEEKEEDKGTKTSIYPSLKTEEKQIHAIVGEYQSQFQEMCVQIGEIERERNGSIREEINGESGEELKVMLKEIHEQLNFIQSQMRSGTTSSEKSETRDEVTTLPAMEAMLHFWL